MHVKRLWKDKVLLFVIAYLIAVILAIPLTIVSLKNPKENRTAASGNATLYYSPSPISKNTGENFTVDIMVNPGSHAVSYILIDILYDPTKLTVDPNSSFIPNTQAFPSLLDGPLLTPGRIRAELSVGFDPTNAITTVTKAASVSFIAEAPTEGEEALVHFGESSYILSVAPVDNATDNVLGTVIPLSLILTGDPTGDGGPEITQIPTFGGPTPTTTPSPTPDQDDTPTPDPSSSPTPTNTPYCEEDSRRSGWPECEYGESTYDKEACRERAENWKGVDGPITEDDPAWHAWAVNPPKPLSCGTSCGIAPSVCQDTTPTSIPPTSTDFPTATLTPMENYAAGQMDPTNMMLVALLLLPIILLAGHMLV